MNGTVRLAAQSGSTDDYPKELSEEKPEEGWLSGRDDFGASHAVVGAWHGKCGCTVNSA